MRWRRVVVSAAAVALVTGALAQAWVNAQTVDLVVVNASGKSVQISWQPAPFAATTSVTDRGCASHSMPISRGSSWVVTVDGETVLESASAGLPLVSPLVAVEVWLGADGSVRVVPPREVARLVDAPYPDCQNASS